MEHNQNDTNNNNDNGACTNHSYNTNIKMLADLQMWTYNVFHNRSKKLEQLMTTFFSLATFFPPPLPSVKHYLLIINHSCLKILLVLTANISITFIQLCFSHD